MLDRIDVINLFCNIVLQVKLSWGADGYFLIDDLSLVPINLNEPPINQMNKSNISTNQVSSNQKYLQNNLEAALEYDSKSFLSKPNLLRRAQVTFISSYLV